MQITNPITIDEVLNEVLDEVLQIINEAEPTPQRKTGVVLDTGGYLDFFTVSIPTETGSETYRFQLRATANKASEPAPDIEELPLEYEVDSYGRIREIRMPTVNNLAHQDDKWSITGHKNPGREQEMKFRKDTGKYRRDREESKPNVRKLQTAADSWTADLATENFDSVHYNIADIAGISAASPNGGRIFALYGEAISKLEQNPDAPRLETYHGRRPKGYSPLFTQIRRQLEKTANHR